MSKLHVAWELPTTRVDGSPVAPADIDFVQVAATLDGEDAANDKVAADSAQEWLLDSPAPGAWVISLIAIPKKGSASDSVDLSLAIPFAQLSIVVNPTIALE